MTPAPSWSLAVPGETPRRCSQPHCGNFAVMHRIKQDRNGRGRTFAYCDKCAALRGMKVVDGLVMKEPREYAV